MNVVIIIDIVESCIHNYLDIYVNLCQHFKIIGSLRKFICRYLIVPSLKPVNIFKISHTLFRAKHRF